MKPVRTDKTNTTLKGEGCEDLPAMKCQHADGSSAWVTAWKLSEDDLAVLQETGIIYLRVLGAGHPPVWIDIDDGLEVTE